MSTDWPLSHFDNPTYSDVSIIGPSGRRFRCHRIVLAGRCDYFDNMFTSEMIEAHDREVHIQEVESDQVLESLLRSIYSGYSIDQSDIREIGPLYKAADHLGVAEVAAKCAEYMMDRCSDENALRFFFSTRDTRGGAVVAEKCMAVITHDFENLCLQDDFKQLSLLQMTWLLGNNDLRVRSEVAVFDAVVEWVSADLVDRSIHLTELLPLVRFPMMTLSELGSIVDHVVAGKQKEVFNDLLLEAFAFHTGSKTRCSEGPRFHLRGNMRACIWNPDDKAAAVELSEESLMARPIETNVCARGSIGFNIRVAHQVYWEISLLDVTGCSSVYVGIARAEANLTGSSKACFKEHGWGICTESGACTHRGLHGPIFSGFSTGDSVGILCHHGSLSFYRNGELLGTAFRGLEGLVYPAVAFGCCKYKQVLGAFGASLPTRLPTSGESVPLAEGSAPTSSPRHRPQRSQSPASQQVPMEVATQAILLPPTSLPSRHSLASSGRFDSLASADDQRKYHAAR